MGFKLGTERGNYAISGEIKTKFRFHKESGDADASVPGTPVIRKPLEKGVLGEANMDGSIYINDKIEPGSHLERHVVNHEMRHATDIKIGKLEYGDNYVKHDVIMCMVMVLDLLTGWLGRDLAINEFVYDSFVLVVLGCFGIAGLEKFAKK
jgi:hypothetical protein